MQRAELELEDQDHTILMKKQELYERMLQLGDYEAADEMLLESTRRIATANMLPRTEAQNRVGSVLARP